MSDKKAARRQKRDIKRTNHVINALRLPCKRSLLETLAQQQPKQYKKLVKKCRPFGTRFDGKTLGNCVFFCNANEPHDIHALSLYSSCFIKASLDAGGEGNSGAPVMRRPNEKLATPLSHFYWQDAQEEYHSLMAYVARDDVNVKLLVYDAEDERDVQKSLAFIAATRSAVQRLLEKCSNKTSTPAKHKHRDSKKSKKDKKSKKHDGKKKKKEERKKKKRRHDSEDDSEDSDEESCTTTSDEDSDDYYGDNNGWGSSDSEEDGSYEPDSDDSEYAGADYSSCSSDDESTVDDAVLEAEEEARREKRKRKKAAKAEKSDKKSKKAKH
jgi:hypothetical protein